MALIHVSDEYEGRIRGIIRNDPSLKYHEIVNKAFLHGLNALYPEKPKTTVDVVIAKPEKEVKVVQKKFVAIRVPKPLKVAKAPKVKIPRVPKLPKIIFKAPPIAPIPETVIKPEPVRRSLPAFVIDDDAPRRESLIRSVCQSPVRSPRLDNPLPRPSLVNLDIVPNYVRFVPVRKTTKVVDHTPKTIAVPRSQEMLHQLVCATCKKTFEIPHSEYVILKEKDKVNPQPRQCKKHRTQVAA